MNLIEVLMVFEGMSAWVLLFVFLVLVLFWKVYALFQLEKGLKLKLVKRYKKLKDIRLKMELLKARNKESKAILSEEMTRMSSEIIVIKRDFRNEIQLTGLESMFNSFEITLATYSRVWQKL